MRNLFWSLCLVAFGWCGLGDLHAADGRSGTDNDHSQLYYGKGIESYAGMG